MKLLSFADGNRESWGIARDDGIVDLGRRLGDRYPTLLDVFRRQALPSLAEHASAPADLGFDAIRYLPPIPRPGKIICIGVNYANRNAEYKDNTEQGAYPSLFIRFPNSVVGHQEPLVRPKVSEQLDYEGEIVLAIGATGWHVPREKALDLVAGVTLGNEGTIRDWLRHGKFNVTQGKNFDRSGSIGPWIVPMSAADLAKPMHVTTKVNGEVRQDDTTESMIFGFAELIAYLTMFTTLEPGDLIFTGTPTGAGARFDPPRWLKPGDRVDIEVPGIGVLSNPIVDET